MCVVRDPVARAYGPAFGGRSMPMARGRRRFSTGSHPRTGKTGICRPSPVGSRLVTGYKNSGLRPPAEVRARRLHLALLRGRTPIGGPSALLASTAKSLAPRCGHAVPRRWTSLTSQLTLPACPDHNMKRRGHSQATYLGGSTWRTKTQKQS